ncbi:MULTISPECIES: carbohydrate kinase family protein [Halolamina]|uniref:Ribokinase/sulfofructose kinase n=1 Tax=Halolamina pelagica TaxID=699431 RepID=A0A1I5NQS2_9EURY|nr:MULTISPECIES: carbohydrate kinase family protein [Halolamina]NHX36433.1 carbohydrate kinase family protein [Halolamina sp. R1-12]SFP24124.1 ribokinase/sulfofructose kinase [Halolamina pelagica]
MSDAVDDVPAADAAPNPDLVAVGAATVDRFYDVTNLPAPDGGAFAREATERFGGVGANVATGLADLDRDTALLARLGDDDLGDRVLADLDAGPVSTALIRRGPGTTTHCVILRGPEGERMIVTAGDSTVRLGLDDSARPTVRAADAVFVTAYVPDSVTGEIVEIAAEPDGPALAFDLSGPIEELRDRGTEPATIDRAVEVADLFVTAEVAAESYLDRPADEAVDALRDRGCSRGAVTFGTDGATLFEADERTDIRAFDVDAVDTTGAGDAFTAALTERWLLGGVDADEAGRFAAAAAALNCRAEGAREGLPDREAVSAFLAERAD